MNSDFFIEKEAQYGAHNYHPLPVVLSRGEGVYVWDVEGTKYYDFLAAYSAVNQGHCHPELIETMHKQASTLALTSRAFYNDKLGNWEEFMSKRFGYDKMLPMNSGAEAVETALKLARKWGYKVKGIAPNEAKIVVCNGNFHGRTITIVSMSNDPDSFEGYGPHTPGFIKIDYNDADRLETILKDDSVAAFLAEPIQAEAGVYVPSDGFLKRVKSLCEKNNVLYIGDEIQTGIARTGKMLAHDYENVRPDILILGKAISGGMYPVSCVLADDEIMLTILPGEHGSTYGGNPIAAEVAIKAIQIIDDEKLAENADCMGELFRMEMRKIDSPIIEEVRGKGLLNAVQIKPREGKEAWDFCMIMKKYGILAKPTHRHTVRFTPPLIITEDQMRDAITQIKAAFEEFSKE